MLPSSSGGFSDDIELTRKTQKTYRFNNTERERERETKIKTVFFLRIPRATIVVVVVFV